LSELLNSKKSQYETVGVYEIALYELIFYLLLFLLNLIEQLSEHLVGQKFFKLRDRKMGYFKYAFIFITILTFQNCSPFESSTDFLASSSLNEALSLLKCEPNTIRAPESSVLKRLSPFEILNTLEDTIGEQLSSENKEAFLQFIRPLVAALPQNSNLDGMNIFDQSVSVQHIEKYFEMGEAVGSWLTSDPTRLNQLTNCQNPQDANCIQAFVENFGQKVFRRPLTSEETNKYIQIHGGQLVGYQNLISILLNSPHFIYHLEFGSEFSESLNGQDTVWLNPYERASKLSYYFLQSAPDNELLNAAKNGTLSTPEEVARQVDRLMKLPKARRRIAQNFANQWMHLDKTPQLNTALSAVVTQWNEIKKSPSKNNIQLDLTEEAIDFIYYLIWEQNADFRQLMTSDLVFPRTEELAEIYSTPVWSGSFEITNLVRAPSAQRAGPLTRAQFLYTGINSTRPIMRGVDVYRNYLCGIIPSPAENDTPKEAIFEDHFSGRETVQAMTEIEGTSCVGCHKSLINPLAFPFEVYDAFGRFRDSERVFHKEGSENAGEVLITKPVNSQVEINIPQLMQGSYGNAVDMIYDLAKNPRAELCMDMKLYSFEMKQDISFGKADCAVQDIYTKKILNGGSIAEAIRAIALQPEFMKRTLQ